MDKTIVNYSLPSLACFLWEIFCSLVFMDRYIPSRGFACAFGCGNLGVGAMQGDATDLQEVVDGFKKNGTLL
jgi:hypothetical protein